MSTHTDELARALRGERKVYCAVCGGQFAAALLDDDGGPLFHHLVPALHPNPDPDYRSYCPGCEQVALLLPKEPVA